MNSVSQKPTIRTARELRALQQANDYAVRPMPGSADCWDVRRKDSDRSYKVNVVTGECSCPDAQNRGAEPCKHWHLINLGLLLGELKAPASPTAAELDAAAAERRKKLFAPD